MVTVHFGFPSSKSISFHWSTLTTPTSCNSCVIFHGNKSIWDLSLYNIKMWVEGQRNLNKIIWLNKVLKLWAKEFSISMSITNDGILIECSTCSAENVVDPSPRENSSWIGKTNFRSMDQYWQIITYEPNFDHAGTNSVMTCDLVLSAKVRRNEQLKWAVMVGFRYW